MRPLFFSAFLLLGGVLVATSFAADDKLTYPKTKRVDHYDVYHGVKVLDPYRWLEEDVRSSKDVADWVEAENKVTDAYLKSIPERDGIRKRLTELWNFERYSAPVKAGKYYFYSKNDGLQNQSVLYVLDKLDGKPRQLLDPNEWSKDGTVALGGMSASDDGKLLAYSVNEAGSDWGTWNVLEVATGKKFADEVKWTKWTDADWTPDNRGFFYVRYPEPKKGEKFQGLVFDAKVCYHTANTPQADDKIVYERPDHPDWGFATSVSEDGKYLVITIHVGTDPRYRITYLDLKAAQAKPVDLIVNFDNKYIFVGNDGPVLYFHTDLARAAWPGHRHRPAQAGGGELPRDHPASGGKPHRRQHGWQPVCLHLSQGRTHASEDVRRGRQVCPRG